MTQGIRWRMLLAGALALAVGSASAIEPALGVQERSELWDREIRRIEETLEREDLEADQRESLLIRLGNLERSRGNPEEALAAYEEVRGLPGFEESGQRDHVLSESAFLYESLKDVESALKAYREYFGETGGEVRPATEPRTFRDPSMGPAVERRYLSALLANGRYSEAGREFLALLHAEDLSRSNYAASYVAMLYRDGHIGEREIGQSADVLLERFPGQAVQVARHLEARGRDEAADYFYSSLLKTTPASLLHYAGPLASFYRRIDAVDRFAKELEARKDDSEAYFRLMVRFYRFAGRVDEAAAALEARMAGGETPALLQELAELHMAGSDFEGAVAAYERLLELAPRTMSHWEDYGEALYRAGQKERAVATWGTIPERFGRIPSVYAFMSEIYERRGLIDEAVEALRRATDQAAGGSYYTQRLLTLLLQDRRFDEAGDLLTKEVALLPILQGEMIQSLTDETYSDEIREGLAAALLQKIERGDRTTRETLIRIVSEIRVAMGRYDQAIREAKSAFPGSAGDLLFRLGMVLKERGELDHAAEAFASVPLSAPYYVQSCLQGMVVSLEKPDLERSRRFAERGLAVVLKDGAAAARIASATGDYRGDLAFVGGKLRTMPVLSRSEYATALALLARTALLAKEGGQALEYLHAAEGVPGFEIGRPGRIDVEVEVLRGEAYGILGDSGAARRRLERISKGWSGVSAHRARFLLAEIDLWEGKIESALARYGEIVADEAASPYVNDALERMHLLTLLPPEGASEYARAAFFEFRGRYEDALEGYRVLAAELKEGYGADWALYCAGRMLFESGDPQEGLRTWSLTAERTEDVHLKARIEFEILEKKASLRGVGDKEVQAGYRDLIESYPDSVFADYARKKLVS